MKSIKSKTQTGQFRLTATTTPLFAKSREPYKRYNLNLSTRGEEGGGENTTKWRTQQKNHCRPRAK